MTDGFEVLPAAPNLHDFITAIGGRFFEVRCLRLSLTVEPPRFCCETAALMPCPSILVTLSSYLESLYRGNSSAEFSLKDHRQRTIFDKDKKLGHVAVLSVASLHIPCGGVRASLPYANCLLKLFPFLE